MGYINILTLSLRVK